jgi:hypothetical protein
MNVEQNTGKPARLSLPERASTYRWYELWAAVSPDAADSAGYPKRLVAIRDAVSRYELPALNEPPPAMPVLKTMHTPGLLAFQQVTWHHPPYAPLVARSDFLAWLIQRGELPDAWLSATPEPARPATPEPVENSLPEQRQRPDALNHAIRAALAVLSPSGALPRPHELFDYLAKNDSTRTITGVSNDGKALLWTGDNGSFQKSDIRALTERLRRWKG